MKILLSLFFLSLSTSAQAEQVIQYGYDEIASDLFWNVLYANGGWSLYCGLKFSRPGITIDGKALSIEHIYPVNRMLKFLKCNSRMQCYDSGNRKFAQMEADLHNLYPVLHELNNALYDSDYGEIEGEDWRLDSCDIERKHGLVEPRPLARGNIARAIFYMHQTYGVPIKAQIFHTLKEWNKQDPPSVQELERNDRIEKIQGHRNPYIDNPSLAENLAGNQAE